MMTSTYGLTGYGPSNLRFDGKECNYEIWEEKFLTHLRLAKLHQVGEDRQNDLTAEEAAILAEKNANVYAMLIPLLDDRSSTLVMRDAKNDGRKAITILRNHYRGSGAPRIISLYMTLCLLCMSPTDTVTEYVLRAESTATALKLAGKDVDDDLLIAMIMKGLPSEFKPFCAILNQTESGKISFEQFKKNLRDYEQNEKCFKSENDSVLAVGNSNNRKLFY